MNYKSNIFLIFSILFLGLIFTFSTFSNSFAFSTIFSDDFQSGFTKWAETGEGDWNLETAVEKQIPNHTSNLVAHSDDCDTSCTITMTTPVDLRSYSSATLTFWRYVDHDLDAGEYLKVELYDGAKWNTVFNWTNNAGDDDTWHQETVNLGSYLGTSNFNVRFVTHESSTVEDTEIDDVVIDGVSSGPSITINDITLAEENSGTTNFVFTVARSSNASAISVNYSTADNTAISPTDYLTIPTTTLNFAVGGPLTQTVTIPVTGDMIVEPSETFFVNLASCVGCIIADNQGIGNITNDDSPPVTTATPLGGSYNTTQNVTLISNKPSSIFYTIDNSIPTQSSLEYTSPISISSTTTLKFFAIDQIKNSELVQTQTYILDFIPPVITLLGNNPLTINQDSSYSDPSATASDNLDGNVTSSIITVNSVDTSVIGSYTVTYNVSDAAGNTAVATRTVHVADHTPPIITLLGSNPTLVYLNSIYGDDGATATDNLDGNVTSSIITVNSVDTSVIGSYTVTYNVSDAAGNMAVATRTVHVADPLDVTPPATTATPLGGTYNTVQSVTLTADESATIYYSTDGSTPTTVYTTAIPISSTTTLKFFAKDIIGNIESTNTLVYSINTRTSDVFGITQIYPTKNNGNTWFMNMANPTSDPRFDPQTTITKNTDGSWKMKNSQVRMSAFSTDKTTYQNTPIPTFSRTQLANKGYMQLPSDWKNFEMTGYVKLNAGSSDDFTWYGRGGNHNSANNGCEGSSTKGELGFNGGTRFAKESWHVHYDFTVKKLSTPSILKKWTGFKFIIYNEPGVTFAQQVHEEIWVDLDNNNNWIKADSFVDDGFGSGASHCGPATADNMPITWGGPLATFRADNSSDFDFKYLSVREIDSPN